MEAEPLSGSVLYCADCRVKYRQPDASESKVYKCKKCGAQLTPWEPASGKPQHVTSASAPDIEDDPLIGQTIAGCKIVSKLGEGGMGAVYRAVELSLERTVALKILPQRLVERDQEYVDRFVREAKSAAQLAHPHTVTVHGAGEQEGYHYIKMQYVRGRSLEDLLKQEGRLDPCEAAEIIRDAARGLGAAHKKGLVHRDVKPGNIMISDENDVLVADFGLAKRVGGMTALTQTGQILGTPLFMSPEQCEGKPTDGRTDIYSLGCTLYQCLTGKPPFEGGSTVALLRHHCDTPLTPLADHDPTLPASLCEIVEKMLEKGVEERYQTCEDAIADLDAFLSSAVQPDLEPRRHGTGRRRAPWVWAGVGSAAVLAVVVVAMLLQRGNGNPERDPPSPPAPAPAEAIPQAQGAQPNEGPSEAAPSGRTDSATAEPSAGEGPAPVHDTPKQPAKPTSGTAVTTGDTPGPAPKRPIEPAVTAVPEKPIVVPALPDLEAMGVAKSATAYSAFADRMIGLLAERKHGDALKLIDSAKLDQPYADSLPVWKTCTLACQRTWERSWARAETLVGQRYKVYLKSGKRGETGAVGKVEKFEDDTLHVKVGAKTFKVKVIELGPTEIARLAAGESAAEKLDVAVLLFMEGKEKAGWATVREVKALGQKDAQLSDRIAQTETLWNGLEVAQRERDIARKVTEELRAARSDLQAGRCDKAATKIDALESRYGKSQAHEAVKPTIDALRKTIQDIDERDAAKLIAELRHAAGSGQPQVAVDAIKQLEKRYDRTAAYTAAQKEVEAIAKNLENAWILWQRLGATVAVPGPERKMQQLPVGFISCVKYSPDSRYLAVAHDFGVDLYGRGGYAIVRRLDGHDGTVHAIDFSPDGRLLASASSDGTIQVWDVGNGKAIGCLKSTVNNGVHAVAFASDGRRVAGGYHDATTRVWDIRTGKPVHSLRAHQSTVYAVAFSHDGRRLAAGHFDGTVRVWDAVSGGEIGGRRAHDVTVSAVIFGEGDRVLRSTSYDGTIRLWDPATGALTLTIKSGYRTVSSASLSPDGQRLALGSHTGDASIWDPRSTKMIFHLRGHLSYVDSVAFSADGQELASGSRDGTVRIWDALKGSEVRSLALRGAPIHVMTFSPDGRRMVSGHCDHAVRVWDIERASQLRTLQGHTGYIMCVAAHPDGVHFASGCSSSSVRVWDGERGISERKFGSGGSVFSLAIDRGGRRMAWGGNGPDVWLWDWGSNRSPRPLKGHRADIKGVAFGPKGRVVLSGSQDGTVRLWEAATGRETHCLRGHDLCPTSLVLDPDGESVAFGACYGYPGAVGLLDAQTGTHLKTVEMGYGVAFSPNGSRLAVSDRKGYVRVLDVKTKRELLCMGPIEGGSSFQVAFTPDGRYLASGHQNGAVAVWDATTGSRLGLLKGHRGAVVEVSFLQDGELLASHSEYDGTVCLWRRFGDARKGRGR